MRSVVPGIALGALLAAGCVRVGPQAVRGDRFDYNQAINQTSNEQVLLNLVRLRYRDTPTFLALTGLSTQYELSGSAGAGGEADGDGFSLFGADVGITYSETPTVSYTPLAGEEFVTQLLSPVPLDTVALLSRSGWRLDRVLRVCIQEINDIPNAPAASGPTPDRAPEFEEFHRLAERLRELQLLRAVRFEMEGSGEGRRLFLRFVETPVSRDAARTVFEMLDLPDGGRRFELIPAVRPRREDQIAVRGRSALGILHLLSLGVQPPPADLEAGRVTRTLDAGGVEFEWTRVLGDLFRISSSPEPPEGAFLAIRYRDTWFSIDDRDLSTKSTFALLDQVLQLQSGDVRTSSPLLTLPLGG